MTRELDVHTFKALVNFHPTDIQIQFKMLIDQRVSPQFLGKILRSQLAELSPYISPFDLEDIETWCKIPGFFEWLILPDSFQLTLQKAKQDAANTLVDLLDPLGDVDPKLAFVRLKAAELVLKSTFQKEQKVVTNNTIKLPSGHIPKHIMGKSVEGLEQELQMLKGN